MKGPVVVKLDDGTALVDLRRYLDARATRMWPAQRTGKRGRPGGGGMRALAGAMGIHPSRLSHILAEAERSGTLRSNEFERIARALGHENPSALYADFLGWWNELTTKKES